MRAYQFNGYGKIEDRLQLVDIPDPVAGPDEVLIDIKAASLNPIDIKIVEGVLRSFSKYDLPHTLGFDGAGVVLSTGRGVTAFKVGDDVFFRTTREGIGSFAEKISVPASVVAHKPVSCDFVAAAALPLVGLTVVQALVDRAKAKAGQSILIHAGSGGVGTFAIQYARHLGLDITTTCSSRNVEFVRDLGADHVITYDTENYLDRSDRYDIVFDMLGGDYTLQSFNIVKPNGNVVSIAGPPDAQFAEKAGASLPVRIAMWIMGRRVRKVAQRAQAHYYRFLTDSRGDQLADIAALVDKGAIKPVIDSTYAFSGLHDAFAKLATGHAHGKLVIDLDHTG